MPSLQPVGTNNGQQSARKRRWFGLGKESPQQISGATQAPAQPAQNAAIPSAARQPQATTTPSVLDSLALNQDQQKMLDALRKAFQGDLNQDVVAHTNILERLAKSHKVVTDLSKHQDGDPVVFKSKVTGKSLSVTKDSIEFVGKKKLTGGTKGFSYAAALEMAEFASLDVDMRAGVTLTGTPKEKALLQYAIAEVNKSLPKDQRIKITNKLSPLNPLTMGRRNSAAAQMGQHIRKNGDFKRDTPLKVSTAEIPTTQQQTATAPAQPQPRQAMATTSVLTQAEVQNAFAKVVDHATAGNGKLTETNIKDILGDVGFTGNKGNAYKQLSGILDQQGITTLKPGVGRIFTDEFKAQFQSAFTNAAGAPQPSGQVEQAQQAGNIVKRALSSLKSVMPSFGQNRGSSPTGGTAPA